MSEQVLNCPFCGKPPKIDGPDFQSDGRTAWAYVRCESFCGVKPMASGYGNTFYYDKPFGEPGEYKRYRTDDEAKEFALNLAIERWNTRT